MAKQEEAKQKPVASFRVGKLLKASIWENEQKGKDNQTYVFKNIQLQKSYTEDNGKTFVNKDISLSLDEAMKAVLALQQAIEFCLVTKE
jgi:hypothetical protein